MSLFDLEPAATLPKLTPEQKRRARQLARIRGGWHPLTDSLRLHPEASRAVEPYEGRAEPFRCGTCRHRAVINTGHERSFPKCLVGGGIRVTNGPGTDVKAWWPACVDYEQKASDV